MKTWNQLFIRQGFIVKEVNDKSFDCTTETEENVSFLLESLNGLSVDYQYSTETKLLVLMDDAVTEEEWLQVVDFEYRGRGEGLSFQPGVEQPKVRELDTLISGIIRQLNRLGLYTTSSCEGHFERGPIIGFLNKDNMETVGKLFEAVGVKEKEMRISYTTLFLRTKRGELLNLGEKLSHIQPEWLEESLEYIRKQLFNHQLEELLSIDGESGDEERIRAFVIERLTPHVDKLAIDGYGNILAQRTYRTGNGPTILLNAHLDTIFGFDPNRFIVKDGPIWSSSEGILGADDRAGVAVLLEVAESLSQSNFNGTVKFVFTVEEEIGLRGAKHVDEYFLWEVDASIVVDRRGTGDIVTSCGGYMDFCHKSFGEFFEKVAEAEKLEEWKCTIGGSSDTRIWASHGIQSVNLSAGYWNEHSDEEQLDVEACFNTATLIKGIFQQSRDLIRILREIRRNTKPNQSTIAG
ncbi:M20/M25/M40 family metallo-hydrolase [Bacillus sp. NTK071]|uniref:M20/M25/M40 family metallo-hydrolase n=1 Tax=Bacillus sp. NTK071 TaxID=2802175 RepID=UPI001A8FA09E|nr:M20/M25/M40 family metallo-hydrolase [Bacillus sp. NTK071]MBN8208919.1 M20/M25/M40 family metallo-hydrolase [Bacillus sp. NTK071]